jgi:hypothetical protein
MIMGGKQKMSTIQISVIEIDAEKKQLLRQLYKDVEAAFTRLLGEHIPYQAIENAVQYVIDHSAFLDGFYFEGDVLSAVRNTILTALNKL